MSKTPKELGFHFPAEWEPHEATWLSWPHNHDSWPGKIKTIYEPYSQFVAEIAESERVNINVAGPEMEEFARKQLSHFGHSDENITFYHHPTNDAWCRDHGPAFVVNKKEKQKAIINWGYNAWGGKYPPFELDDAIPGQVASALNLKVFEPGIIMEGGSVDFNGNGVLLTTTSCLLNPNRNPELDQNEIEKYLKAYYGVKEIWWLGDGIAGDDTDGHIDDITRFTGPDTVVTVVEKNRSDENYLPLIENLATLEEWMKEGRLRNIIELPTPNPVIYESQRLPASYANFYITNEKVIVPIFQDENDDKALSVLSQAFPDKKVLGIQSRDIIWGLGSFHCLSQQEPKIDE